jgi:hypothetical protein
MKNYAVAVLALIIAVASVAFTNKKTPATSPSQACVWYKLNRTPGNPNPNYNVASNYTRLSSSVDIKTECPQAEVLCAVCLTNAGTTPNPVELNNFQDEIQAAEQNGETATVELRQPIQ